MAARAGVRVNEYPGIYRAVCSQVQGNKIKVKVPQLLGEHVLEEWAEGCVAPGWKLGLLQGHAPHTDISIYLPSHSHTVDVAATTSDTAAGHTHSTDIASTTSSSATTGTAGTDHTHTVDPAATTSTLAGSHSHTTDPAVVTSSLNGGGTYYQGTGVTSPHDHNHVQHQLTPKVGEGCWVMFEGGDIDHPVWMGVFNA